MEDVKAEKIAEDLWQTELKIITVKVDMKKLDINEKIEKEVELKQLQQEVKNLHYQEKKRNEEVAV